MSSTLGTPNAGIKIIVNCQNSKHHFTSSLNNTGLLERITIKSNAHLSFSHDFKA